MIEIIEGNEEHIPTIVEIAEKTWRVAYATILTPDQMNVMLTTIYSPMELKRVMFEGTQNFLLLKDKQAFQGFASFGARPENRQIYKLHKLYVLPEKQGKGFGAILIEEVKKRLRKQNINILELNVNRYNPAQKFYNKLGFRIMREEDVPVGQYFMNDYVMRLELGAIDGEGK